MAQRCAGVRQEVEWLWASTGFSGYNDAGEGVYLDDSARAMVSRYISLQLPELFAAHDE